MTRGGWILALGAAGCVSKGRYEVVEVQLHATRTALSARAAECTTAAQEADAARAALEAEIALRQAQLDALAARAAATDGELMRLEAARVALADEVARLQAALEAALARGRGKAAPPAEASATPAEEARRDLAAELAAAAAARIAAERVAADRDAVLAAFASLASEGLVAVEPRGDAAVVRIPTRVLFQEGFTTLSPRGRALVERIADRLREVPHRRITVEGHTDDRPRHSAEMASNWERGFSRAVAVLRGLEAAGAPASLSAASFADTRPRVPPDAPDAAVLNARVEIVIEADPALVRRFAPSPAEDEGEEPRGEVPASGG